MNWKRFGACRKVTGIDFFPNPKHGQYAARPAKQVCSTCIVRGQCLDWALTHDELGVWGGTTEKDRKWIKDRYIRRKALAKSFTGL